MRVVLSSLHCIGCDDIESSLVDYVDLLQIFHQWIFIVVYLGDYSGYVMGLYIREFSGYYGVVGRGG